MFYKYILLALVIMSGIGVSSCSKRIHAVQTGIQSDELVITIANNRFLSELDSLTKKFHDKQMSVSEYESALDSLDFLRKLNNREYFSVYNAAKRYKNGSAKFIDTFLPEKERGKMRSFEKKYKVGLEMYGSILPCDSEIIEEYNMVLMDLLYADYGKDCIEVIPSCLLGKTEYLNGKLYPCADDIATEKEYTVVAPVVILSYGKAASGDSEKDDEVLYQLAGEEFHTAVEFIYCGKVYYMPISKNNDWLTETVEKEFAVLEIQFFNPLQCNYSESVKPYPFGIIRQKDYEYYQ